MLDLHGLKLRAERRGANRWVGVSLVLMVCFMPKLHAAELYRVVDENGKVTFTDKVPPQQVKKGYDVLDSKGREKGEVAPEVSSEVRAEQERQRAAQEAAKRDADEQLRSENLLLQLYPSEQAIQDARASMLQTTESKRIIHEMNVYSTEARIKYLSAQTIQDKSTSKTLEELKKTLDAERSAMQKMDAEKKTVNARFDNTQAQWRLAKARQDSMRVKAAP